jgi:uncharacterized lipoprotein YmbA
MKISKISFGRAGLVLLISVGFVACGSTPVEDHYYSLVLDAGPSSSSSASASADVNLGLDRIVFPEFLQSRNLITQVGTNEVLTAQHHFWAEPLDDAISKLLIRYIGSQVDDINVDYSINAAADCSLRLEFDQFQATDRGAVVASGRYWLNSSERSLKREFEYSVAQQTDGYKSAVLSLGSAVRTLAGDISDELISSGVCSREQD